MVWDRVDRQVIHALQLDPRVAFSRVADAIGVSEQTVSRRYRRMRQAGLLRVLGLVDPTADGVGGYLVRVQSRPDNVDRLAHALAERPDVTWVTICAGGSEIVAAVRSRTQAQRDDLLLQRLPNASHVTNIATALVLHRFPLNGGSWHGYGDQLTPDQTRQLTPAAAAQTREPAHLNDTDRPLTTMLAADGRTSWAALAHAAGRSTTYVTDRVEALLASGVLYFDVDLVTELLGFRTAALLWLTVEPAHLATTGHAIATHDEVSFAAAVTGSANLFATVICRDTPSLYTYLTETLAHTPGITGIETTPVLRRVKQKAPTPATLPASQARSPGRARR